MITFACGKCGNPMKVPESAAGRVGTCKKCGTSLTVPLQFSSAPPTVVVAAPQARVQTIQATSKSWKLLQLIGGLGAVGSVSYGVIQGVSAAPGTDLTGPFVMSFLAFSLSVFLLMMGRFFAWWFNG